MVMVRKSLTCRICGNSINNREYCVKEMMFGLGDVFSYFQCSNCDCLQIAELPDNVEKYYPPNYYSFTDVKAETNKHFIKRYLRSKRNEAGLLDRGMLGKILCKRFPLDKDEIALNLQIDFEKLKRNISFKSRILDVGCGNGVLLCKFQVLGFKHLLGIDAFIDRGKEYSNGVKVRKMIIHDVDGVFDFIMFHHSFEHMPDPFETLKKVCGILSSNGVCLIRVPVVSSHAWNRYGVNWVQLDAPRHFFLHSTKSMSLLLEKTGLKLQATIYDSTDFQFWGSEQYVRNIPLRSDNSYRIRKENSIFATSEIQEFKEKAKKLNDKQLGDQAAFYISK